jgi:hypothetical protein
MDFNRMMGQVKAQVIRPGDTVVITVERYLTGQQLVEIQKHFQRRLPGTDLVVLHGGMDVEVVKPVHASARAAC